MITKECINCGACQEACPTGAIFEDMSNSIRVINPDICTECVGFYERTMCQIECPIECIEIHPQYRESLDILFERAKRLFPNTNFSNPPPSHLKNG